MVSERRRASGGRDSREAMDQLRPSTTGRGRAQRTQLRVALVVAQFPVLSEPFIVNQAVGLLERGHEVTIFALDLPPPATDKVHPVVERYRLLERAHHAPSVSPNYAIRAVQGLRLLVTAGRRDARAQLRTLNPLRYGLLGASLHLVFRAQPFAGRDPFDIVHCQFGTQGTTAVALRRAGVIRSCKIITTFRGHDISRHVRIHGPGCYRELFRYGDYFLANCDYFRNRAIALGCDPARIATHRSGIDCTHFPLTQRRMPPDGPFRVASVGRLVEKKGFEYALRAVARLASASDRQVTYQLIGDGPLRPELEALARKLGIGDLVEFTGAQPQHIVRDALVAAHTLVAPSVTARDGDEDAPINTLKEAMATGLPVVATCHGGIPELVESGVSGFLVPECDADAIAARLLELAGRPEIWPALGAAGRRRVEADYDMERLNDELVRIYERVLAGGDEVTEPGATGGRP